MAPGGGGKRKRGERTWSSDSVNDGSRPSPHRPNNLNMAQHNSPRDHSDARGRGRRQNNRGGRNNLGRRPSSDNQNQAGGRKDTAMSPPNTTPAKEAPDQNQANGTPSAMNPPQPPPSPSPAPSQSQPHPPPPPQIQISHVPPVQPAVPPPPFDYEYVSDTVVEAWSSTGKQKLVEDGVHAKNEQDIAKLAAIYQEVIRAAFYGRLSPTDAGAAVKDIIGEDVAAEDIDMDSEGQTATLLDTRSLFLDTLSIVTDSDTTNPALKPLVFSTGISAALMRLQLDTPLLQSLGLVRDTFARMGIRKQTNLLYRQSNYNLLREESEGYSKLLTELFTTSNNEPPSSEVVEDTFERVKAMIGAFDMDVGRVLDVTLDVFAAVLVKQYRFFVKLLRASSWWPKEDSFRGSDRDNRDSGLPNWALPGSAGWVTTDEERAELVHSNQHRDRDFWKRVNEIGIRAFFEIGRKPVSEEELKRVLPESNNLSEEEAGTRKWIEETGTLPPKGNRVAAQLLGFKLRFYSSRARNKSDILPDNLIYLAALLIKVGFISLRDLYPHLWRPDDSMDLLKEEKMKEKAERERAARPGGGVNALMMAGALSDDTLPAPTPRLRESETRSATPGKDQETEKSTPAKTEEDELPEPSDQKVMLLKSLLAIGALPESLFLLSKFPWLMDGYPELPEFIHRILHHCLSKVYASLRPLPSAEELREQKQILSSDQSGIPKGQIRLTQAPPRRVLRWAQLDKEDTNDGTDYRFYWDDWADNVPLCQNVDDVFALCSSFLNLSGHKIGQDASLLTKLARIGKDSLSKDDSPENKARWKDLCKRLLVPAISLTKANPGVVNEVFDLVSFFPRETRYNMYAEWYSGQTSRLPDVKSAFDQARAETKDVLKRLSKTNIRPMARALAKIAYANPGIVINVAISQIESYENLIEVVVECARYFTNLGYDILTWALINSLGQKGRSRVQEGGLLTSRWLNALSTFAGRTFKRYSVMDPTPVLQYVVEQLRHNNSTDLIVLEQMISSMAGIITDTNFNDNQIQAMAGGEVLQAQTILQLLDRRHESKTTSRRLMKALTVSKLAGQLLIAIAQERWTCIFQESEGSSELKLLGNVFDEIHRILAQYLDLLRSNMSVEEFDSFVPDLASLISEFGVQPEVAFWIRRPSVAKKISESERTTQEEEAGVAKSGEGEEQSPSKDEADKMETDEGEATAPDGGQSAENDMDVDKDQSEKPTDADAVNKTTEQAIATASVTPETPLNPVMQDLQDQVKSALPSETWGVVGLHFYATFWQLSLYDVHIPQKAYEDEIDRQKKKVIAIGNDRSDISMAGSQRKEREKKQITQLQDRILEENKAHLKSYGLTRTKLQKEKDRWFAGMRGKHDALNVALLEQCFMPRLLLSPIDAFYCFKLLKFLHTSGTPNFRTVGLLDQLFREQRLTALIFQCTSREADNLGRFLNEIIRDLGRWHADKAVYEKEAFGTKRDLPGFAMLVDPEGKPTTFLEYEDFRRLLYKWHRLLAAALKTCLNGGEYMHIRNAISVLKGVVQNFPAVNWIGRDMLTSVNNLSQNDERDDVKIPAASLIGDLNRREKKWMLPQAFMITSQPAAGKGNPPKSESVDKNANGKSLPSRPQSSTPGLNASATEFKPTTEPHTSKPEPIKTEVEDGEIEDAKMTDAVSKNTTETDKLGQKSSEQADTTASTTAEPAASQTQQASGAESTANEKPTAPAAEPRTTGQPTPASPAPAASPAPPKGPEPGRQANIPRRPDPERAPLSNQNARSQTHTPNRPYREDGRLPPRPDLLDDRRDRHSEYPRGGRYGGEHDYNRSFEQPVGDGRGYGRLDREYPLRPSMDEPFRGPPYREGRLPREPEWPDRSGRLRPADARDAPPVARSGPPTHPDRAEMIHDHPDREGYRRGEALRQEKDERRSLPSRTLSPPRVELPNRPERFPDDRRSGNFGPAHSRHEDLPTGPRSERVGRPSMESHESRDPDLSHGRLRQPEPPAEIPSGPRMRNAPGRGGRGGPGPSNGPNAPNERQPPTGPGRQGMRGGPDQSASAAPSSPGAERLDTTGIHPDRLKNLQPQPSDGSFAGPMRPGHPSSPASVVPPSGPRSALGPPQGPSSLNRGPPQGPGYGGERGRGDKRFAGLNNMLQQSGGPAERPGPGPTIRGRGANRQPAGMNTPQAPDESGRLGPAQNRPDLMAGRPSTFSEDDGQARNRPGGARGEPAEETGSESRRSVRYSGHDRDREREHNRERDRDRDRERDRRTGEEEGTRSGSRREEHRDRTRDYERERSRRSDAGAGGTREERYESREASRRGTGSRDDNRRRRDREDASDAQSQEHEGRLRPPSSLGGHPPPPPPPPPLPGNAEEDRRWGGGGGREPRDRDRDRNRDRQRDRDYNRDGGSGGGGSHRKRGRPGGDESGHGEGGGRGGMRMGGESKRPRRGA
ncbi:transcription factor/nuclear export subunit protein 2-domain-containing protein [Aspergillus pseudonomiae]|uniref:THO complex subunit 2 n=1 Tax=Aspergillus pseudonomiae TaxID=1506151 RepID=A0A5N6IBI5_9EURO|nr:transcription factor/nuclear export subunit protein 2-domain-containing protein [Aspergillus pseudonomiae]KAB8264091.1 transcription factor/nuclear export subunit protein 2-domain-containing protein [Aspergillus pseudonomiae]KAE8405929.1 transcription factor/nuclear export subunit protein 2-domain-containing protein [Aspergillus pseudonomiae]